MKALVLGTGAREHAIAWRLSPHLPTLLHPGNAGTLSAGIPNLGKVPLEKEAIAKAAQEQGVSLIVIGPETLLAQGYADFLRQKGFKVVGPHQTAAQLESSKLFSKRWMDEAKVQTAPYHVVESEAECLAYPFKEWPIVLKFDGLAAGKGVVVAQNMEEVRDFADRVWNQKEFGNAKTVIIEKCIFGKELSYIGLCDGQSFIPLASATDHKRLLDNDQGPNTGGMGCISPSPYLTETNEKNIWKKVIDPLLAQMKREKMDYRGILFIGLMITETGEPYVLEFNTRFGDPETQAILIRLESNFEQMMESVADGTLSKLPPLQWNRKASVYVVAAAEGYPQKPRTGDPITGFEKDPGPLFFAGVDRNANQELVTSGGRVLGVGALGDTIRLASDACYERLSRIQWQGKQNRNDIGR